MIIFVGSSSAGYFAKEVCQARNIKIEFVSENNDINEQVNDILFLSKNENVSYIIFDIDQYFNDYEEIVEKVVSIKKAINTEVIILSPTLNDTNINRAFIDSEVKSFIVAGGTTSDKKDELEKNITGFYKANERKQIVDIEKKKEEEKKNLDKLTTIAVAGTSHKVGVSTQCFQIVKYLNFIGYKACYFELNSNKYESRTAIHEKDSFSFAEKIKSLFDVTKVDDELGKFTCEGVDIYYNPSKLSEVLAQDYEFIVYDYGVYKDKSFNKTAFLKDDINIFITTAFITEIDKAIELSLNTSYKDSKIIFNFTDNEEQENIIDLFSSIYISENESNKERCYFTEFNPNLFKLTQHSLYENLFNYENKSEETQPIKEKKIFSFKRKRG